MSTLPTARMRKAIDLGLLFSTLVIVLSSIWHSRISWLFV